MGSTPAKATCSESRCRGSSKCVCFQCCSVVAMFGFRTAPVLMVTQPVQPGSARLGSASSLAIPFPDLFFLHIPSYPSPSPPPPPVCAPIFFLSRSVVRLAALNDGALGSQALSTRKKTFPRGGRVNKACYLATPRSPPPWELEAKGLRYWPRLLPPPPPLRNLAVLIAATGPD